MTEIFTKVKAVKAPKLMNDVEVATSKKMAIRPMIAEITRFATGVWYLALRRPNTALGSTESRPMAYISREALACAARPEANCAATKPARNTAPKNVPPICRAISLAADAESANAPPGWTSWVK